eukprot:NODE_144_length_17694_cov_0.489741.p12 type:complete len:125 gc:universal NODE_144_length_17694_cov_0.489741:785-1159(+)
MCFFCFLCFLSISCIIPTRDLLSTKSVACIIIVSSSKLTKSSLTKELLCLPDKLSLYSPLSKNHSGFSYNVHNAMALFMLLCQSLSFSLPSTWQTILSSSPLPPLLTSINSCFLFRSDEYPGST